MQAAFYIQRFKYRFRALDPIDFGAAGAANSLRGAFGWNLRRVVGEREYARIFQPVKEGGGPSGLADRPRPFVLRAAHLDGAAVTAGAIFEFDVHLFAREGAAAFGAAVAEIAKTGIGIGRGKAEVVGQAEATEIRIDLATIPSALAQIRVEFCTPMELKSGGGLVERPDFAVLFARVRDRVATLRALYGEGMVEADFIGLGQRAHSIATESCTLKNVERTRRSSRTGQTHGIGGFTGKAIYSGNIAEFWPWLEAAEWTGVGRQTVWGKGQIRLTKLR